MARMHDPKIWWEDWFYPLPESYKLFFLFLKDECDHAGLWRINRSKFQTFVLNGKIIHLDDFLLAVNKADEDGETVERVVQIGKRILWLPGYIPFQCGQNFRFSIGAHRGALKLLVINDIHPSRCKKMDWGGLETLDLETLKKIDYSKSTLTVPVGYAKGTVTLIEPEIEKEREIQGGKGSVREKPNPQNPESEIPGFPMQQIFDSPWSEIDQRSNIFKGVTEALFDEWKSLVNWIIENRFTDAFRTKFLNPADYVTLRNVKGFTREMWEPVFVKMASSGLLPQHNLYFRIQDFLGYVKPKNGSASVMNAGQTDWTKEHKW